jgi:uncharacterized protein with ParB-like and HNH nuclease domain
MNIKDIPRFKHPANYFSSVPWGSIERTLFNWSEKSLKDGMLGLDLNPDFQRGHVWTEEKQIAFVEFCLKGGDSSRIIIFNHPNWMNSFKGEMVLVDGKQRLEAVRKFLRNELSIFDGNFFKDFDNAKMLLRSSGAYLTFAVNNLETRQDVLEWYLELNSGGVVHTSEEINKVKELLKKELASQT